MAYRVNGVEMLDAYVEGPGKGCIPSSHEVGETEINIIATVGGAVASEPPTGIRRTHTWNYDGRPSLVMRRILDALGTSHMAIIDTYDNTRDEGQPNNVLWTNVVVIWKRPLIRSRDGRGMVDSFSFIFEEAYPQTGSL